MTSPASPQISLDNIDLMALSLTYLRVCKERELKKVQEEYSVKIDTAFRKLNKSRENLMEMDQIIREVHQLDDILQSMTDLEEMIQDFNREIGEFKESSRVLSAQINAVKNDNLTQDHAEKLDLLPEGDLNSKDFGKNLKDLALSMNNCTKSANDYVKKYNNTIDGIFGNRIEEL
ncbi:hypothetical protein DMENIID0001_153270 [Sergentomyia squamirostris]